MKRFEHPYVVGLVSKSSGNKNALELKRKFNAAFAKKKLPYAYLVLKVEPRYLKNLILCMKMMDIVGVNISKAYEKQAFKMVDAIDISAKSLKKVNLIVRKSGRFIGYFISDDMIESSISLWSHK